MLFVILYKEYTYIYIKRKLVMIIKLTCVSPECTQISFC